MIEAILIDPGTGKALYTASQNGDMILISQTHAQVEGKFQAKTLTAAGTVIVSEPDKGGCINLTDFILTSDKTEGSEVTVQYTDGSNTIPIMVADMSDAPVNIATALAGKWEGWRDARLELVITGGISPTATLAAGYYKLQDSKLFDDWDAQR